MAILLQNMKTRFSLAKYSLNNLSSSSSFFFLLQVANYVKFAKKRNLTCVSALSIVKDDFNGMCLKDVDIFDDFKTSDGSPVEVPLRNSTKFPLMQTIHEAFSLEVYRKNVDANWYEEEENEIITNENEGNKPVPNTTVNTGTACNLTFDSFHAVIVLIGIVLLTSNVN